MMDHINSYSQPNDTFFINHVSEKPLIDGAIDNIVREVCHDIFSEYRIFGNT